MQLVNKWQRGSLLLILIVALGVSACTAATSEPAAPVEAIQPLESERVETERAPARNSEGMVGTQNGELTGTLERIEGDLWTIEGQTFLVNRQTEVKGDFAPGDEVKVHTMSQADGTAVLREVEPAVQQDDDDGDDDSGLDDSEMVERELTGTLEAVNGEQWTIAGQTFLVTNQTEVKGSFAPGDQIKIHFFNGEDGALTLREIELAGRDDDVDDDSADDIDDDSDDDTDDDFDDSDDDSDDDMEDDSDDADDDLDDSVDEDSDDDDMDDDSDDDSDADSDDDIDDDSDDDD